MIRNQAIKYLNLKWHELRYAKLAGENDTLSLQKVQRTCFVERSEDATLSGSKNDVKIHLITVSTPAENEDGNSENPTSYSSLIDSHIHLYNSYDGIQEKGATIFGLNDFDKVYNNNFTNNILVDVSKYYSSWNFVGSHSFDVDSDAIKDASQAIDKLKTQRK